MAGFVGFIVHSAHIQFPWPGPQSFGTLRRTLPLLIATLQVYSSASVRYVESGLFGRPVWYVGTDGRCETADGCALVRCALVRSSFSASHRAVPCGVWRVDFAS